MKIAMDVLSAKVPNSMGYSFLLLSKVSKNISEAQGRVTTP